MMLQPQRRKGRARGQIVSVRTRQAPTLGWNSRDPEANMQPGYALYLDNFFPDTTKVVLRKGATDHVTGFGAPVKTLMGYNSRAGTRKLFACTNSGIFDATAAGAVGASVSSLTEGRCSYTNFSTTGGSYLFVVNATNDLRQYDGTSWTTTASYAISGGGTLNTNTISFVTQFKRMLFFVEQATMNFYFLPVDAIAGTVSRFPLGALFTKGGFLTAIGTWTVDGGQGVDDYCVFVSSEGQIAVYRGTDPSSASTWALQGVYNLSSPLGARCLMKYGGDLIYLSQDGAFPLSKALQSTTVNIKSALTDRIGKSFAEATGAYGNLRGWQSIFSLSDALLLVNVPTTEFSKAKQFVMNTLNGAWCSFSNWNALCWELVDNQLYMGMSTKVAKAWVGGNDFGLPITAYAKAAYDYYGLQGSKTLRGLRPVFRLQGQFALNIALDTDFVTRTDYGAASFATPEGALYDSALWVDDAAADGAVWVGDAQPELNWMTVAANPFYCAALRLRAISKDATVEWSSTDFMLETGGILS